VRQQHVFKLLTHGGCAMLCSVGVVSGLRQLLEFGLFHGDPHPGNIFCLRDGRIAYVDFGNVAQLSNSNKQVGVRLERIPHAGNSGRICQMAKERLWAFCCCAETALHW
jgi:predicted unusual protein kinase regulating ubiquinone biosynthesis (AarF/ABC1/UbiB family)